MEVENVIFGTMYAILGLFLMVISIPLKNGKVGMNHTFGVRLRKSYTSEKNWYLMNTYGGKQLLTWSAVLVVLGIVIFFLPFNGNEALIGLFVFMPVIVLLIPTFLIIRYSKTLGDN
jgi:hypothetical protein